MNAEKDSICIVTNCYLANVTNESNYIILACKIDDHQVYMYDGNLNRYEEYKKLANSKENCEFKIKVKDNRFHRNFFHVVNCNRINDNKTEMNFKRNLAIQYSSNEKVMRIFRSNSKIYNRFFITTICNHYALFLNKNTETKLDKLGIDLNEFWPLDQKRAERLLRVLINKIDSEEVKIKYEENLKGLNIIEIELAERPCSNDSGIFTY